MIVKQIWTNNALRNFNYLIACPETGDAMVIDPLDHVKCLNYAKQQGWEITKILNTHEHRDHTGGNQRVVADTGAEVLAHHTASHRIPEMTRGLHAGNIINVGNTIEIEILDTPGHTMSHVCLLTHTEIPALFSGDTLFNAGAGNCHNGGNPYALYATFVKQLAQLTDQTRIYPGHDYLHNNLAFTLDREPNNQAAATLLQQTNNQDPNQAFVTCLAQEKEINTFFRLQNPEVIDQLQITFPELGTNPDPRNVFLKLRELRNNW